MKILISNDDGYKSEGIKKLYKSLTDLAEVYLVAPLSNCSAASSSLTITKPLTPIKIDKNIYAIDGTPSDCVHMALCGFIKEKIDLVVTGINHGANLGDDVIYSGTVAGAIEGRFIGLPSIAFSITSTNNIKNIATAGKVARILVENIHNHNFSIDTILNVNIPDISFNQLKGMSVTRLGKRHKSKPIYKDNSDNTSYWIGENGEKDYDDIGTDFFAIENNYVSITPLQIDLTRHNEMHKASKWINQFSLKKSENKKI